MEKLKTVSDFKRFFDNENITRSSIKEQYGDLRLRSTWEQAYSDYTYVRLPIIKAIAEVSNFVPPMPPRVPIAPPITQPLLPPAKEYPALPPAREPQEKPGDGRREQLQKLPLECQQLLIAVLMVESGLPASLVVRGDFLVLSVKKLNNSWRKLLQLSNCNRLQVRTLPSFANYGNRDSAIGNSLTNIGTISSRGPPQWIENT
ncbi:MAG: hypothetical protein F6K54_27960 [Okeania sp. SIO3B5]|uniref:hypothetical protein n=1 Tax=Okeania sp. SIO3B5 TaxID=2607811 RepID=UPI0014010566|nr:hypothetical protein [Okeania sp. SIO3B5]NEO56573.1 hypothetical protein [Okeania sp. SIO3B5]